MATSAASCLRHFKKTGRKSNLTVTLMKKLCSQLTFQPAVRQLLQDCVRGWIPSVLRLKTGRCMNKWLRTWLRLRCPASQAYLFGNFRLRSSGRRVPWCRWRLDATPRWIPDRRALRPETAEVQAQRVDARVARRDRACCLRRSRLRPPEHDSLHTRETNSTTEALEYQNV